MDKLTAQPRVGLALGGGGVRGLAHIGVLKVLEREEIPIYAIAGTSMGGLIGAAYAAGLSATDLEAEVLRLAKPNEIVKLVDWKLHRSSLLTGDKIYSYFVELLGNNPTFAELKMPLALLATDMNSGQEVVLCEGSVVDAMRATMSVPGVFANFEMGNYRLADGGLLNNVPADVAWKLGSTSLIAVDVMPNFSCNKPGETAVVTGFIPRGLPSITHGLWQAMLLMMSAMSGARLKEARPNRIIRPHIPEGVTLFQGLSRAPEIIAAGETAAAQALPHLGQLIREMAA